MKLNLYQNLNNFVTMRIVCCVFNCTAYSSYFELYATVFISLLLKRVMSTFRLFQYNTKVIET